MIMKALIKIKHLTSSKWKPHKFAWFGNESDCFIETKTFCYRILVS